MDLIRLKDKLKAREPKRKAQILNARRLKVFGISTGDYEKMFEKIVYSVIDRFYENVNWKSFRPGQAVNVDLFDFFKKDVAN